MCRWDKDKGPGCHKHAVASYNSSMWCSAQGTLCTSVWQLGPCMWLTAFHLLVKAPSEDQGLWVLDPWTHIPCLPGACELCHFLDVFCGASGCRAFWPGRAQWGCGSAGHSPVGRRPSFQCLLHQCYFLTLKTNTWEKQIPEPLATKGTVLQKSDVGNLGMLNEK